jgi:hypothetical protein
MRWFGPTGYDVGNNGGSAAAGADGASGEGETLSGVADRLQTVVLSLCAVVAKQSTTPLSQWTEGGDGQCVWRVGPARKGIPYFTQTLILIFGTRKWLGSFANPEKNHGDRLDYLEPLELLALCPNLHGYWNKV